MLPRYKRLLRVTHSLSTIYGTNSIKAHCVQIIKTDKTTQINKILDTLAYQLHMSRKGLNQIQLGNLTPYYKILIAYNESISNKQMLITYLCTEALESISLRKVKSFKKYLVESLCNKTKISLQMVKLIAEKAHMPYQKAFYAFKNSGIKIYDKVKTYPVISNKVTNRQLLNNYIWCLSYLHNKDEHWDAQQIGIKYDTLHMAIKHTSAKNIARKFKKLRKYYPQLTYKNIQNILTGKTEIVTEFLKSVIANIQNRTNLLKFLTIYFKLHNNVSYKGICKKCQYNINDIKYATHQKLYLWLHIIQHISQMPVTLLNKLLKLQCLKTRFRQLPSNLKFKVNYHYLLNKPNIQPDNQSKIQELSNKLSQAKNIITAWIITKQIIKRLGYTFNFDYDKFIHDNFDITRNEVVYIQGYSLLTIKNFQELLRDIYKQFLSIQNLKTFKNLNNFKYKDLILINNKTIAQVNDNYHPIQRLINKHRHEFTATFENTDIKTISSTNKYYKEYYRPVIVLSNIYHNGKLVLHHAVMNYTKTFINLHSLNQGDKIKFDAMAYQDGMTYNLNRLLKAKIISKVNNHKSYNVPTDIRALTWYAIKENKSKAYDFTTWGKNYGYIRFCKQQYKLWEKSQNKKGTQK